MLRALSVLIVAAFAFVGQANAETYRLRYEAAVLGVVVVGEARYEIAVRGQNYAARGAVQTSGAARIFDQTDITATATGTFVGDGVSWTRYDLSHAYAGKFRRIRLDRAAGGVTADVQPRYGNMGDPAATAAQQLGSYDPLSAMLVLGRQIGFARACRGSALVFDGRQHYRLSVTPRGEGNFTGGGYNGPALNCNFRYEPIAGFSLSAAERANIPVADAWFALPAQAGFAAPLRLTVPTPMGPAQLDLRSYERVE